MAHGSKKLKTIDLNEMLRAYLTTSQTNSHSASQNARRSWNPTVSYRSHTSLWQNSVHILTPYFFLMHKDERCQIWKPDDRKKDASL
jgi:hypothetical protein